MTLTLTLPIAQVDARRLAEEERRRCEVEGEAAWLVEEAGLVAALDAAGGEAAETAAAARGATLLERQARRAAMEEEEEANPNPNPDPNH